MTNTQSQHRYDIGMVLRFQAQHPGPKVQQTARRGEYHAAMEKT